VDAGHAATALKPLYDDPAVAPAYQLRYDWTAWSSEGAELPGGLSEVLGGIEPAWEDDGLRVLETRCSRQLVQVLFSVKPTVSPVFCAARAKGRLQYALRKAGHATLLQRKLSLRSVGENATNDVRQYILSQVDKETEYEAELAEFTRSDESVRLAAPTETRSSRYWYNLHLVLVTEERYCIRDLDRLRKLQECALRIARKKGYAIAQLAVLPDHLHVALRGNIAQSPQAIAWAFQNNLAYALGQCRIWQDTYYVGTFGEYGMGAIRRCVAKKEGQGQP
jgi:REP element-mobilizing transposase RayT